MVDGISYDATLFSGRRLRETAEGPLSVTVDSLSDPVVNALNKSKTRVNGPLLRISIGYGENFVGPPQKILLQTDIKVSRNLDFEITEPKEQIRVHCRNLKRRDLMLSAPEPNRSCNSSVEREDELQRFVREGTSVINELARRVL